MYIKTRKHFCFVLQTFVYKHFLLNVRSSKRGAVTGIIVFVRKRQNSKNFFLLNEKSSLSRPIVYFLSYTTSLDIFINKIVERVQRTSWITANVIQIPNINENFSPPIYSNRMCENILPSNINKNNKDFVKCEYFVCTCTWHTSQETHRAVSSR